jgi:hypothetical protein
MDAGYERWARASRAWVQAKIDSRSTDQESALNESAKASFETLSKRFDAQEEKSKATDAKVVDLQKTVNTMAGDMAALRHLLETNNPPPAANPPAAAAAPAAQEPVAQEQLQQGAFFRLVLCIVFLIYSPSIVVAPPIVPPRPQVNINEGLRATPRLPILESKMPKSMLHLVKEWEARDFESFRNVVFRNNVPLVAAFNKRKYLYDAAVRVSEEQGVTLAAAAGSLDNERGGTSMPAFHSRLKAVDPTILRRSTKKQKRDATPPPARRPPPPPQWPPPPARRPPPPPRPQQFDEYGDYRRPLDRYGRVIARRETRILVNGRYVPFRQFHENNSNARPPWEATAQTSGGRGNRDEE